MNRPIFVELPTTMCWYRANNGSPTNADTPIIYNFPVGAFIYTDGCINYQHYVFEIPLTAVEITTKIDEAYAKAEGGFSEVLSITNKQLQKRIVELQSIPDTYPENVRLRKDNKALQAKIDGAIYSLSEAACNYLPEGDKAIYVKCYNELYDMVNHVITNLKESEE